MNFQLLHLPQKPLLDVLRCLENPELIAISMLSSKCRETVKSLNFSLKKFIVTVNRNMSIYMVDSVDSRWRLSVSGIEMSGFRLNELRVITIEASNNWKFEEIEIRKWIENLMNIYHCREITSIDFERTDLGELEDEYYLNLVRHALEGIKVSTLNLKKPMNPDGIAGKYAQNALELFSKRAKYLSLCCNPYQGDDRIKIQKVLMQNFNGIWSLGPFTIDDILVTNSRTLRLTRSNTGVKDLNRFIKHWMAGSNPRLRFFSVCQKEAEAETLLPKLLNGIPHITIKKRRLYKTIVMGGEIVNVHNDRAIKIRRKDGREATILYITNPHDVFILYMFIR
ncbi:hypothetical protein CRE_29348 [Caenorhabditis remanei]|uniref:F-box domain-containing protein n=1 Tax=Caenorhabditis remanei TaxID=31234 RepID=E3MY08_CAERE|nr:hypothetical protein CRE_29348 [Caenorhabditis remanei]